jgi:hypothetical protein
MNSGKRIFDSYREALAYTKSLALLHGKSPVLKPAGNKFEVFGEGVTNNEKPHPIDLNDAKESFNKTKSMLENSTNEFELNKFISSFLKKYGNSNEVAIFLSTKEDLVLYETLEDIHLALIEFIELLDEASPKSSDQAEYYSKRFFAISKQLQPYKIAARPQKEGRETLEKGKKLPVVIEGQQQWFHKISILNSNGPMCRHCTDMARMHIVGDKGSELWRCTANNHGTRFLNKEERKFLSD